MEERADSIKAMKLENSSNNSRKNKKRGIKKGATKINEWCNEDHGEMNGIPIPSYSPMFWQQSGVSPHIQHSHNGQRLFTAMSDPSVCGYSTVPVAYAMEPVSMPPIYPLYRPIPRPNYRALRGRPRLNITRNQHHVATHVNHQNNMLNGYSSLQDSRLNYLTSPSYQNGDYTSLPPTANNHTANGTEELNSEHRRYSDPGLGPADLPPYPNSDDSDSGESGSSITTVGKNNKLVLSLVEQMTALREANSRMFRELHETKLSLQNMRTELVRVKQHASSDYQPGMLSDIISEIRETNKVVEETLMMKLNAIIQENNHQTMLELREVKGRLSKMTEEKAIVDKKIMKLEEDITGLKVNLNNENHEIAANEEETLTLRRELQEARTSRNYFDNGAAKCVDTSIASLITRVNLNTPCITSTPTRTDILNSFRINLADCQISSSSTSSNSSLLPSSFLSNSLRNIKSIDIAEIHDPWKWNVSTSSTSTDLQSDFTLNPSEFTKKLNYEKSNNPIVEKINYVERSKKNGQKQSLESTMSMESDEKEALEQLIHFHFNRKQSLTIMPNSPEKKIENFHRQCNSINGTKQPLSFSYIDLIATSNSSLDINNIEKGIVIGNNNNILASKSLEKNGVAEVPNVVVVAGKSVVPKHLCSTRILTSRVLTTPSHTPHIPPPIFRLRRGPINKKCFSPS
ncbi:hypothetical protein PV327_000031 [Microctonus hyperodae]|uniref:Uncharacterized protein n=1 Tax=Microctonus hyperodae TaxID=165561 RepID=A0AA39G5C8_MICHY|nr:hypothetical protein PV327_000031 [Microctonus hyperodae]